MYEKYCSLRDMKGLTDAQVAKGAGVTRSTFTDWKNGRSAPKRDKMEKIADYLGVKVDYFYENNSYGYYLNEETAEIAQSIFEDKDLRVLFDAAKDSSPGDLQMAANLLKRLKGTNPDA